MGEEKKVELVSEVEMRELRLNKFHGKFMEFSWAAKQIRDGFVLTGEITVVFPSEST